MRNARERLLPIVAVGLVAGAAIGGTCLLMFPSIARAEHEPPVQGRVVPLCMGEKMVGVEAEVPYAGVARITWGLTNPCAGKGQRDT